MDRHIKEYYHQSSDEAPHGNFHSIITLHEAPDIKWEAISAKVPNLPRGWYELAYLPTKDRIEFIHDYWQVKLPYRAGFTEFIDHFFASLDDIGVFLRQKKFDDPYDVDLVYSLKENRGFYRGNPPVTPKNLEQMLKYFANFTLPSDFLAFLQIHDGFCKTTDCTGVTRTMEMPNSYKQLQALIQQHEPLITSKGTMVDPKMLIPFYESFGMPFYQCFWGEWYPEQEMGNVYYSYEAKTISDVYGQEISSASMAFPTFVNWLKFYLERIV